MLRLCAGQVNRSSMFWKLLTKNQNAKMPRVDSPGLKPITSSSELFPNFLLNLRQSSPPLFGYSILYHITSHHVILYYIMLYMGQIRLLSSHAVILSIVQIPQGLTVKYFICGKLIFLLPPLYFYYTISSSKGKTWK